jgi:hypothetical protein
VLPAQVVSASVSVSKKIPIRLRRRNCMGYAFYSGPH